MSNIIDSIQLSGVTYSIQGSGGGGSPTVEVTQAEYDALVSAGTVSADTYYIITDAQSPDITQYWTSAQTQSAITQATSGKVDSSSVVSSVTSASTNSEIPTAKAVYDATQSGGGGIDSGTVQTMIDESLSGYVTTDTLQDITAQKTFVGDPNNNKKSIKFKQYNNQSKVGFVVVNSADTNNELATFEFRPNTYTDSSSVSHPLLYIGHYRNNGIASAGVPQTMVGYRQYDQSNSAAYHYLMPLPAEAKTPFSLTTSFKNYFAPLGFKNGSTMITTDNTGVADFSDVLGGLKLVKLTQQEYDALSPNYDNNTLYVIT